MNLLNGNQLVSVAAIDLVPGDILQRRRRWMVTARPVLNDDMTVTVRMVDVRADQHTVQFVRYAIGDLVDVDRSSVNPYPLDAISDGHKDPSDG